MRKTFEPFRQLKGGVWRDYALISSNYTRFEVVDLELGKVIAIEDYPQVTQKWLDGVDIKAKSSGGWAERYRVGDEMPNWGFCPVEFHVFDWRSRFDDDSPTKTYRQGDIDKPYYSEENINSRTGQWALYTGCMWGDDSSMKLRYIDLSKISEGIVTSEDRFGYFPLGCSLENISYDGSDDSFDISLELTTSRLTGKSEDPGVKWARYGEEIHTVDEEKDE